MTTTQTSPVAIGTRVRILPPRDENGHVVRDTKGFTGQLALVVEPNESMAKVMPNTELWLNVELELSGKRWYLPTDRIAVVRVGGHGKGGG